MADRGSHKIYRIEPNGMAEIWAGSEQGYQDGPHQTAKFDEPYDVALDELNNVYVLDSANFLIRQIDSSRNVRTLAGTLGVTGQIDGNLSIDSDQSARKAMLRRAAWRPARAAAAQAAGMVRQQRRRRAVGPREAAA